MHENTLQLAGLTKEQAAIYETLIVNGSMKAGQISKKTDIKRGLVYFVLDQLVELGLVEKSDETKVVSFRAVHPVKLQELAEEREQDAKNAQIALTRALPEIISRFNLISGLPGVQFFEGLEGFKKIYDDKLKVGETIYLIRTVYEPVYQNKVKPIVHEFVKKRVKLGIPTIALTPPRPLFAPKRTREDDLV